MPVIIRVSVLVSMLGIAVSQNSAQSYNIVDLGTFPGGTVSQGQALNDCGEVAGYARFANYNAHAFIWTKFAGLQDLGAIPPQQNFSVAQAINAFGIVAGYSTYNYPPNLSSHAALWIGGQILDLGGNNAQAMGINLWGNVVGYSVPHAFLWTPFEGMHDLGNLPGGYYSQALAINSRDEVVGFSNAKDGNWHGFLWTKRTGMLALPFLPGGNSASANAINEWGLIAGGSASKSSSTIATLWSGTGRVEALGTLPGQGWSSAFAINDSGQVVGWSGFRAFIWSRSQGIEDLNDLIPSNSGWVLTLPTGINVRGQITGEGSINGESHAFLLTPAGLPLWSCR